MVVNYTILHISHRRKNSLFSRGSLRSWFVFLFLQFVFFYYVSRAFPLSSWSVLNWVLSQYYWQQNIMRIFLYQIDKYITCLRKLKKINIVYTPYICPWPAQVFIHPPLTLPVNWIENRMENDERKKNQYKYLFAI